MTETAAKALVVFAAVLPATAAVIGGSWTIVNGHPVGGLLVLMGLVMGMFTAIIVSDTGFV